MKARIKAMCPPVAVGLAVVSLIAVIASQVHGPMGPDQVHGATASNSGHSKAVGLKFADGGEQQLAEELAEQDSITITPYVPPRERRGGPHGNSHPADDPIDPSVAIANAQADLGFLADASATATLVSFTDPTYGPEVTPTPGYEGVVEDPIFVDVPAYAVSFGDIEVPLLGPDSTGQTQECSGVYFVDAYSGALLEFVTLTTS